MLASFVYRVGHNGRFGARHRCRLTASCADTIRVHKTGRSTNILRDHNTNPLAANRVAQR